MNELLNRINHGYDGLIREIRIFNGNKDAEIVVSVMDYENNREWINIVFLVSGIREFTINQKLNFSNAVLSDGIKFKKIDCSLYVDFAPYADSIETIEDFRFSEIYFGCDSIKWKVMAYNSVASDLQFR